MTNGSVNTTHLVSTETYDITVPGGVVTSRGFYDVGQYWSKVWAGVDYPVKSPPEWETVWGQIPAKRWVWEEARKRRILTPYLKWHRYRRLVRKPKRIRVEDHQYSLVIQSWTDSLYSYRTLPPNTVVVTDHFRTFRQDHGEGYAVDPVTNWNSNDDIALIGKLRNKICGSDFDMGVFLGEGHQTLALIANSARRISKALLALKRRDVRMLRDALQIPRAHKLKDLRKNPEAVADVWIEVQYGWRPLVDDAYGAAQALAQMLNFPMVQTYRVRKHKAMKATVVPDVQAAMDYEFAGFTRGQLIARLKEVNVPQLIGLTDPASVAWELLPWSFVADWFIPIGEYLSARGLASAVSGVFVTTKTTKRAFKVNSIYTNNPYVQWPGHSPYNGVKPWYRQFYCNVERTVSTSLQVPLPSFKPLGKALSWMHCSNAVALLVQRFSSTKGYRHS